MSVIPINVICDNCKVIDSTPYWFLIEHKSSSTKIIINELNNSIPQLDDLHACGAICLGKIIEKLVKERLLFKVHKTVGEKDDLR